VPYAEKREDELVVIAEAGFRNVHGVLLGHGRIEKNGSVTLNWGCDVIALEAGLLMETRNMFSQSSLGLLSSFHSQSALRTLHWQLLTFCSIENTT